MHKIFLMSHIKCIVMSPIQSYVQFLWSPVSLVWAESNSSGDGRRVWGGWFSHAAYVTSAEHTLQRPQHDDNKQQHEHDEEHQPLPVCRPIQPAESPALRLDRSVRSLAGPNVNADAEGRGTVGGARVSVLPGAFVAQLLPVQPHRLLLLLVGGQLAEDLVAGGQGRGSLLGQHGGVTAEGARQASAGAVIILVGHRDGHEAGEALQAEGVGALQLLGCFEDIVVGVEADGALWLAYDWELLLHLANTDLGLNLHVPNLRSLFHLENVSLPSALSPSLLWTLSCPRLGLSFTSGLSLKRMKSRD